jgi:hypothetical protein
MTHETTAHAVADPHGVVMVETIRSTAAKARAAAVNALHWPGRWPSMMAAGYTVVDVAVRIVPDHTKDQAS